MPLDPSTAAKYLRPSAQPVRRWASSPIDQADQIPIQEIFTEMGMYCPDGISGSWKMRCPWGEEHKDGGVEPHFRVYAANTAHCFAMHGTFRPVSLLAKWNGWGLKRTAEHLLERRGLDKPQTYGERWTKLQIAAERANTEAGDSSHLVRVVQNALERDEAYRQSEYSEPVIESWSAQLAALDELLNAARPDSEQLRAWVHAATAAVHEAALTAVKLAE